MRFTTWWERRLQRTREVLEVGHPKLKARERVARQYHAARKDIYFKVEDMIVYKLHVSSKQKGISSKMKPIFSGPVTTALPPA